MVVILYPQQAHSPILVSFLVNYSAVVPTASFHFSARREEDAKTSSEVAKDEGFMGTGISHLYALPLGVCAAVPILEFQWFRPNEEMLLASTFVAFCVVAYTKGGAAIANGFKEEADAMLKIQNDAEKEVIAKMEENLQYIKLTENIVQDYQAVFDLTKHSYEKLNEVGKIKPAHQLKAQVEKVLSMIAVEEQASYEKAKTAMMKEATAAVTAKFLSDEALKKAALDSALAKIAGTTAAEDPVQKAFVDFFKQKGVAAKKADGAAELKEARTAMLAKMNAVAENEGFYFRFDESGTPKMVV
jgi:Mitochondrial ATP synthase B chain precursor (ATP-synt_B)